MADLPDKAVEAAEEAGYEADEHLAAALATGYVQAFTREELEGIEKLLSGYPTALKARAALDAMDMRERF